MSIVTLEFFIFVAAAVLVYWICPAKARWTVLLIISAAFVIIGTNYNLALYGVFVAMTLAVWVAALAIKRTGSERGKSIITGVTVAAIAVILILYKDLSFFVNNGNLLGKLVGLNFGFTLPAWAAPLGISYFSLILIAYLLDVRWETISEPQANPFKMLAFAGYFPHLTSGPFTRYNDIKGALFGENKFDYENFCFGLQRFLWGLFKKLVIADHLAPLVANLYSVDSPGILSVVVGAFLYVLQLYTDFSGCMDIVIGTSQLFGIPLAENFKTPFYSVSLSEWWRRWHITLGAWLKDYVLYPAMKSDWMNKIRKFSKTKFGKKASNKIVTYTGMLITWFCVGFWHGGSWKYICSSGLFFFVMIVGGLLLEPFFAKLTKLFRIKTDCWSWVMFQRIRTFLLFSFSVSFGRAGSLTAGLERYSHALRNLGIAEELRNFKNWIYLSKRENILLLALLFTAVLTLFLVSLLQHHRGEIRPLLAKQNLIFRWAVLILLLFSVLIFGAYGSEFEMGAFIYQGF